jgi:hypothetical protein
LIVTTTENAHLKKHFVCETHKTYILVLLKPGILKLNSLPILVHFENNLNLEGKEWLKRLRDEKSAGFNISVKEQQ